MRYKAFISYSRAADDLLAPRLESALKKFGKPWYKPRSARCFRDRSSLGASTRLWSTIERALDESEYFLLLASPQAAKSGGVRREVAYWKARRPMANLLVVLTDGKVRWAGDDYDWEATDALPNLLEGAFAEEPDHVDLRWVREEKQLSPRHPNFRDAVAKIAATLHGIPKDELIGEDIRQHRRTMAIARGGGYALLTATAVSFGLYLQATYRTREAQEKTRTAEDDSRRAERERDRANNERVGALRKTRVATALRLASESRATREQAPPYSVLLAVESLGVTKPGDPPVPETDQALVDALANCSGYGLGQHEGGVRLAFSRDGTRLATTGRDGMVKIWSVTDAGPVGRPTVLQDRSLDGWNLAFSHDDRRLVTWGTQFGTRVWDLEAGGTRTPSVILRSEKANVGVVAFSREGSRMAALELLPGMVEIKACLWDFASFKSSPRTRLVVGHASYNGRFRAGAFSPDGRWLVTTSDEPISDADPAGAAKVRVWDLSAADPATSVVVLPFDSGGGNHIEFSRDGRWLALEEGHGTLALWGMGEITGGSSPKAPRFRLPAGKVGIQAVAFGPDSSRLVIDDVLPGRSGHGVRLWDLTAADPARSAIKLGAGQQQLLAVSRDGRRVATKASGHSGRVWDLSADDPSSSAIELRGHEGEVGMVAFSPAATFSPDGGRIATGGEDRIVRVWDLSAADPGQPTRVLRGLEGGVSQVAFDVRGRWLAAGGADGSARLWDMDQPAGSMPGAPTLGLYARNLGAESGKTAVAITADSHWLVTCGDASPAWQPESPRSRAVYLWDLTAADPSRSPTTLGGYHQGVDGFALSPDDRWLATTDKVPKGGTVLRLWDLKAPGPSPTAVTWNLAPGWVDRMFFSRDARWLVASLKEGGQASVQIWDLDDPATRNGSGTSRALAEARVSPGYGRPQPEILSPDGRWLAGASARCIYLWGRKDRDWTAVRVLENRAVALMKSMAFSSNSRWLVTIDRSTKSRIDMLGDVRLWDLTKQGPSSEGVVLPNRCESAGSVAIGSGGRRLAILSRYGAPGGEICRVWNLEAADPFRSPVVLSGQATRASRVELSQNGRWVATVGDGETRLWDLDAPDPSRSPIVLRGVGGTIAFDPGGRRFVADKALYDLKAPEPSRSAVTLPGGSGDLFSPDGRWLVSGRGWLRLWPLRREELVRLARRAAGRSFQAGEWERAFLEEPYRPTFGGSDGLPVPPSVVRSMLQSALDAGASGDRDTAARRFSQVSELAIRLDLLGLCNEICWRGSLAGYADSVLEAGKHAVEGRPDDHWYRDTRGIARALTGDRAGAAADFLAYAAWTKHNSEFAEYPRSVVLRERWAAELQAGRDPISAAVLETLRAE